MPSGLICELFMVYSRPLLEGRILSKIRISSYCNNIFQAIYRQVTLVFFCCKGTVISLCWCDLTALNDSGLCCPSDATPINILIFIIPPKTDSCPGINMVAGDLWRRKLPAISQILASFAKQQCFEVLWVSFKEK